MATTMLSKSDYSKLSASGKRALRTTISGRGAYKVKRGRMPRKPRVGRVAGNGGYASDIGGALGGALGSLAPVPGLGALGKWAGSKLGGYIGKIFGSGAYQMPSYDVRKNSFLDEGQAVPQFDTVGKGTIVSHREYLQDISSSTSFSVQTFSINPGVEGTFPWMNSVAANYDAYEIMGMIFEFVSTSADSLNSTNTALGSVIMATDYSAGDLPYANKQTMLESEYACSARPSVSQIHIIECARRDTVLNELYVRNGAVPAGQDPRLYDLGLFQIATAGMQAAAVIGELWVSYKIRLIKPKLTQGPVGNTINWAQYVSTSGITTSAYFGTQKTQSSFTNTPLVLGTSTITFPSTMQQGCYLVSYYVEGASTSIVKPSLAYTNCAAYALNSTRATFDNSASSTGAMCFVFGVQITGGSAVVTFSGGTLNATATLMILSVTQIPSIGI